MTRQRLGQDWEVAQALAERRLLSVGRAESKAEETAEIAHEALIREWPTFTSWVNDDADFQHWLASVEERAADGELLPDTRLAEADRWLTERATDIPHEVTQLVQDSKSEWQRRVTELENARNRAEQAAREAEARRLAAAAELALTSRQTSLQVPIALAVESLRTAPVLEADTAARHAIRTAARQISRLDHGSSVSAVAFSPDGTRVATGSDDGSARVFDAATGAQIYRLDQDGTVSAVAFSPDGTRVATGSDDRAARGCSTRRPARRSPAWTTTTRVRGGVQPGRDPGGHRQLRWQRAGVRRGDRHGDLPPGPRQWGVCGGVQPGRDPGGHRQRRRSQRAGVRRATGAEIARLDHDGAVSAVAFSPDGTRVATGSYDGSARVFDAATGTEIARLDHDDSVSAVAFSPDGTRVATGSYDRQRAGVRRGDRHGDRPPGPRRQRVRGGVQPGRDPGGHRQLRWQRAGLVGRSRSIDRSSCGQANQEPHAAGMEALLS